MTRAHVLGLALASAWAGAGATEGAGPGGYPDGLENFMSGALPPPGTYGIVYAGSLRYDTVRDGAGSRVDIPDFAARVDVVAPRIVWVSGRTILDGQLALHAVASLPGVAFTCIPIDLGGNLESVVRATDTFAVRPKSINLTRQYFVMSS